MTDITDHLVIVERRIADALQRSQRPPGAVQILAVSKGQAIDAIAAAHAAGLRHFGENYLAEALEKIEALQHADIVWHFIGRVQSNKTAEIARKFDWVHTIDREKIARRLSMHRAPGRTPLQVLIQVNLAAEPQKGGVSAAALPELIEQVRPLPGVRLRGLMAMPPVGLGADELRRHYREVATLARTHRTADAPLDVLSMGMSGDFDIAVECGATIVRVGTVLFGRRASSLPG